MADKGLSRPTLNPPPIRDRGRYVQNEVNMSNVQANTGIPFGWSIGGGIEALSVLAGVRFHRMFNDLDTIVMAYREGTRIAREWYGPDISFGNPCWGAHLRLGVV